MTGSTPVKIAMPEQARQGRRNGYLRRPLWQVSACWPVISSALPNQITSFRAATSARHPAAPEFSFRPAIARREPAVLAAAPLAARDDRYRPCRAVRVCKSRRHPDFRAVQIGVRELLNSFL
jgi:hypothetical protein